MWANPQWMQTGLDALRATVDADPSTKRDMIQFLLDEQLWDRDRLSWDAAVTRFNACLNPGKPDFFKFVELWLLMKRFGRHELFLTLAADLGYEVRPLPTDARLHMLLERLTVAMERAGLEREAIDAERERWQAPLPERRLDPAIRQGTGRFSKPPPEHDDSRVYSLPLDPPRLF